MTRRALLRREFLGALGALGAGALLGGTASPGRASAPGSRKLILVVFGGGTRSSETMEDPEHRWIPRLWGEVVPRGTLWTNVRVEGKVVHPNATAAILTGHDEWDDIDWTRPVRHPTIFEVLRKARGLGDVSTWAFVYASILSKVGESLAPGYGRDFAANVVVPPTIPRASAARMDELLRVAASTGSEEAEIQAANECARIARETSRIDAGGLRSPEARRFHEREYAAWREGGGSTSHDAFLADRAIACMRELAPDLIVVAFGEIDCAHYGSWSRYVDAIRRTDDLTARLWRAAEELPEYRGRTHLLVLPDHGRELDRPGRPGFLHHSDFYTGRGADEGCRRIWMVGVGPSVTAGARVDRPVPAKAAAAKALELLEVYW